VTAPDLAQICNLLYRRIAFGRASESTIHSMLAESRRLQICDTAECNSALRPSTQAHSRLTISPVGLNFC
jgi:hypothetical protein